MKKSTTSMQFIFMITALVLSIFHPTGLVLAQPAPSAQYAAPTIIHVPGDAATLDAAFTAVPAGGIIELAAGTYVSPNPEGWNLSNINKRFTVRAAAGANVVLSGGGTHWIIRYQNADLNASRPITFQGITFADGYSGANGMSGGVTIYKGKVTFIDCKFENNRLDSAVTTQGGAVFVVDHSTVFFINTTWTGNNAMGGGALGVRDFSNVYIHQNQFLQNNNGNLYLSIGGAINLGNSTMRITNTRFDGNRAGLYGGAVYIIGNWAAPYTTPQADVIIANSVFSNNSALHDQTSGANYPTEGGAINIEDQSRVKVYSSRFINNSAGIAGAINDYRSSVEVYGSVFLGNQANDTSGSSGFGGAISLNSTDIPADGGENRPNASLILQNSWVQGRYGTTTTAAISGACLASGGDGSRLEDDSIPNVGSVAENRAIVNISNSVFYDCDTHPSGDGKPASGGIYTALTALTFQNSVIASSDATGQYSSGGAFSLIYNTTASISGTTLAGNSAAYYGGAMFTQGSNVVMTNSKLFENSVPASARALVYFGSAIFSTIDEGRHINMTGAIENNMISSNPGWDVVFDDDRNVAGAPINDLRYNGNTFYRGPDSSRVYWDSANIDSGTFGGMVEDLNDMVVTRPKIGIPTDKSPLGNNVSAQSKPVVGTILAAPSYTLSNKAMGESSNPTARVIYTWSGGSAQFNGNSVSGIAGTSAVGAGTQTLTVGNSSFTANVAARPNPSASFSASASAVNWAVTSGSFLDSAIDQDIDTNHAPSGTAAISDPVSNAYHLLVITQEGGYLATATNSAPALSAPDSVSVLVGLSPAKKNGSFKIQNTGAGTLTWTASSSSPITLNTTSGSTTGSSMVYFTVNANKPGDYTGTITIQSNGGSKVVNVSIKVVQTLEQIMLPQIRR